MTQEKKQSPAMDGVKKGLNKAADLTSLKIKLTQAKAKRKAAYTRLGELSYSKYRPRTTDVSADIESAIQSTVAEITELTQTIVELDLRIKLLKSGA